MFGRRIVGGPAAVAAVAGLAVLVTPAVSARADDACRTIEVSWTTPGSGFIMAIGRLQTYDTGVVVPAPGAGETATVVSSGWASFDRYPEGSSPTREASGQTNERWGITIGGTSFGGLTPDLPDTVAQGAPTSWYSGMATGSFGTGSIGSGALVLRHASLFGFTESPNSVYPQQVSLQIQYCRTTSESTTSTAPPTAPETTTGPTTIVPAVPAPEATSTTTPPAPTTDSAPPSTTTPVVATAAPTTSAAPTPTVPATVPATAEPTTTFVLPLLTAPTVPQQATSTTITPAGPTLPTTVPIVPSTTSDPGRLPETGSDVTGLLQTGLALVLVGSVLAIVRRRLVL